MPMLLNITDLKLLNITLDFDKDIVRGITSKLVETNQEEEVMVSLVRPDKLPAMTEAVYILPTRELRMRKRPNNLQYFVRDHTCKNLECKRCNGVHHVSEDGPCKACCGKDFYCRLIPQHKLCPQHEKKKRKVPPIPWFKSMFHNIEVDLEITPAQECNRPDVPQEWMENCKKAGKLVKHHRNFPVGLRKQSFKKRINHPKPLT
jgi:hypothetical protein